MTINAAYKDLIEIRNEVSKHENAILDLCKDALQISKNVNRNLVELANESYGFSNGIYFLDEEASNVELHSRISAMDHVISSISGTIKRMKEVREYLDEEGEF